MSSTWGKKVKISIFGESHGEAIGVTIDGFPAGFSVDFDKIMKSMAKRAPGNDKTATTRKEPDVPVVLSGFLDSKTTGAPICAIIKNTNTKSADYGNVLSSPRPGHADYTGFVKYSGNNNIAGGGHFSGRLTAPLVFAGALCEQYLETKNIKICAHISGINNISDNSLNTLNIDENLIEKLKNSNFPLINKDIEEKMRERIIEAKSCGDSVGGTVECGVYGLPSGIGEPMFDGLESVISSIIFGIPAVKGIEFGKGFGCASLFGSENNDEFFYENGIVKTKTNNCGGILGGISNGMPLIFNVAVKPTASISKTQNTVDLQTNTNTKIAIKGRHDPCIVPRAVPVIEAATAIALINFW